MIVYLQQNTRLDISTDNHQCARFVNKPVRSNEQAIIRIARYMRSTNKRGIIFQPDPKIGPECFVDADFAGFWSQADADDPYNVMYCSGHGWELPVLRYHEIMVIYPYPFLVVTTKLLS